MNTPTYHGGYSEIWKGEYQGHPVAVKELKVHLTNDLNEVTSVGSCCLLKSVYQFMLTIVEVLQGGSDMGGSLSSKCAATLRGNNGRPPICDGIRVDGKWEYQSVH